MLEVDWRLMFNGKMKDLVMTDGPRAKGLW